MIHQLSAMIQAWQRGMGSAMGQFGHKGPGLDGAPTSAQQVLGPTPAVRKADRLADQHRSQS